MGAALWLASREVSVRRRNVALAAAVVAALTGAVNAMELVARAREEAVAASIDAMGPTLTVVPRGTTPGALARLQLSGVLPGRAIDEVIATLGADLRTVEERLVLTETVAGGNAPVIGVNWAVVSPVPAAASLDVALLGSELARRLGPAGTIDVGGRPFRVAGVMPSTGSAEDVAVLLPLEAAQALPSAPAANELRVYLRAGVQPRDAQQRLRRALPGAEVIRLDRGEVADGETQASLVKHRSVAYVVMGVVAALCLVIAAHLDAAERRIELATLTAIGASRGTLLGLLLSRSALVAAAGAVTGTVAGGAIAVAQDPVVAGAILRSGPFALACIASAVGLGLAAAAPTAFAWTLRDPVPELQES
jgi:putative ABC transport system permease protein